MKGRHERIVAILYALVLFLDRLDLTTVNVALPTLARSLDVSVDLVNLVTVAFFLAFALMIPLTPWITQRLGLKRAYFGAVMMLGLGSTLCALAPNFYLLVLCRFVQGLGAGALIPLSMTWLYRIYDPAHYARITGLAMGPALLAPAVGPPLGGVLMGFLGWRAVFCFAAPLCLVILFLLRRVSADMDIPACKEEECPSFDLKGYVTISGFLLLLFGALSFVGRMGLTPPILIGIGGAVLCLLLNLWFQKRTPYPILDFSLYRRPLFFTINWIQLCFQICHFGSLFFLGTYVQTVAGLSPSQAGLVLGMQALGAITSSRFAARIFHVFGPHVPVMCGLLGLTVATPFILFMQRPTQMYIGGMVFFFRGMSSGLCGPMVQTLSVTSMPKDLLHQASSLFQMGRQIFVSLGGVLSSIVFALGCHVASTSGTYSAGSKPDSKVFILNFVAIALVGLTGAWLARRIPAHVQISKKLEEEMDDMI